MKPEDQAALLRKLAQPDANKLALTESRKASPLIDRSQNPIVGRQNAPAAAPVPTRGARSIGAPLDTSPTSSVPGMPSHKHMHYHADGAGGYYQHDHPHSHPVRHKPSDDMDENLHEHHSAENKAARFERLAKFASEHSDFHVRAGAPGLRQKAAIVKAANARKSAPIDVDRLVDLAKTAEFVDSEDWHLRGAGRDAERELNAELSKLVQRATPSSVVLPDTVKAVIERSIGDLVERLKRLENRR